MFYKDFVNKFVRFNEKEAFYDTAGNWSGVKQLNDVVLITNATLDADDKPPSRLDIHIFHFINDDLHERFFNYLKVNSGKLK